MNSIAHQEPHAESINPADNKTLTVFRKDKSMELCRQYGIPPYKVIVLHGGPGAPGCAAGLCRILEEDIGVLKHLQKACTIDGFMDEILYLIKICSFTDYSCRSFFWGMAGIVICGKISSSCFKSNYYRLRTIKGQVSPRNHSNPKERAEQGLSDMDNYHSLPETNTDML